MLFDSISEIFHNCATFFGAFFTIAPLFPCPFFTIAPPFSGPFFTIAPTTDTKKPSVRDPKILSEGLSQPSQGR